VKKYLDILINTFIVRQLQPLCENISKRQVKSPKIYIRDSGILHTLLGITSKQVLSRNPKLGESWEGYALEEIVRLYDAEQEECFFWATHSGAELDLIIEKNGIRHGFEFKYTSTPKVTKSMQIALLDLKLDSIKVIFPGDKQFKIAEKIEAIGLCRYLKKKPLSIRGFFD